MKKTKSLVSQYIRIYAVLCINVLYFHLTLSSYKTSNQVHCEEIEDARYPVPNEILLR